MQDLVEHVVSILILGFKPQTHAAMNLQDLVDQHLRDTKQQPVMQSVMGGKFAQQIICKGVPFRSEKVEEFFQVRRS